MEKCPMGFFRLLDFGFTDRLDHYTLLRGQTKNSFPVSFVFAPV
jgi:hypothetical protein